MDMFTIRNLKTGDIKIYHNISGIVYKVLTNLVHVEVTHSDEPLVVVLEKSLRDMDRAAKPLNVNAPVVTASEIKVPESPTKAQLKMIIKTFKLPIAYTRMGVKKMREAVIKELDAIAKEKTDEGKSLPVINANQLTFDAGHIEEIVRTLSEAVFQKINFTIGDSDVEEWRVSCGFISKVGYEAGVCDMPNSDGGF